MCIRDRCLIDLLYIFFGFCKIFCKIKPQLFHTKQRVALPGDVYKRQVYINPGSASDGRGDSKSLAILTLSGNDYSLERVIL